jgi:hypothetical protein
VNNKSYEEKKKKKRTKEKIEKEKEQRLKTSSSPRDAFDAVISKGRIAAQEEVSETGEVSKN